MRNPTVMFSPYNKRNYRCVERSLDLQVLIRCLCCSTRRKEEKGGRKIVNMLFASHSLEVEGVKFYCCFLCRFDGS